MRWLRRHGYHAVTSADLARHGTTGQPLRGRPVLITFDDGYRDFHDTAWPILRAHDFIAEVFIVTDHVGVAAPMGCWFRRARASDGLGRDPGTWRRRRPLRQPHGEPQSHDRAVEPRDRARSRRARAPRSNARLARPAYRSPHRSARRATLRAHRPTCGYEIAFTAEPGFAHSAGPAAPAAHRGIGPLVLGPFASAVRPSSRPANL